MTINHTTNKSNEEIDVVAEAVFQGALIEIEEGGHEFTPLEMTLACAKIAQKFAGYAGDLVDF